jgi:nucleoside-diphosphate-sugar epimerase
MSAQRPAGAVLVTGAAGGIGRVVVERLTDAGLPVVAADREPFGGGSGSGGGGSGSADDAPFDRNLVLRRPVGDVRDPEFVASCLAEPAPGRPVDAVVHLAAIPSPNETTEEETLEQNVLASFVVLQQAGRHGARRVVVASSVSAVGLAWADRDLSPSYVPVDERHPTLAVDPYGLSKVVTEEIAAFTTRRWGMPTVCLRFPFVGTGERLRRRLAEVHADPAANRLDLWSWLDTRDAAGSVLAALTVPLGGHHVVNVTAADTTALQPTRDLLRAHHPAATVRGDLTGHAGLYDTTRASELLGFHPPPTRRTPHPDDPPTRPT